MIPNANSNVSIAVQQQQNTPTQQQSSQQQQQQTPQANQVQQATNSQIRMPPTQQQQQGQGAQQASNPAQQNQPQQNVFQQQQQQQPQQQPSHMPTQFTYSTGEAPFIYPTNHRNLGGQVNQGQPPPQSALHHTYAQPFIYNPNQPYNANPMTYAYEPQYGYAPPQAAFIAYPNNQGWSQPCE